MRTWKETGVTYLYVKLPRVYAKGQIIKRSFGAVYVNSFTNKDEYWVEREYHPSKDVEIVIDFLKSRPPVEFHGYERRGPDTINIDSRLEQSIVGGRQRLRLFITKPHPLSSYVIRWKW